MTLIEHKAGLPAACVELLRAKMPSWNGSSCRSFDWDYLAGCHALAPHLVLAALGEKEFTARRLDEAVKTGTSVVAWEDEFTTADTIAAIYARGLKACGLDGNAPERVVVLVEARIDGIIRIAPHRRGLSSNGRRPGSRDRGVL